MRKSSSMNSAGRAERRKTRLRAIVFGSVAAIVTAGAVSWATPDGNLVVTLVPALAMGLLAFGVALWRLRRSHAGP